MPDLIHDFIADRAEACPESCALLHKDRRLSYIELQTQVVKFARGLHSLGIEPGERVAVYLPKQFEAVIGLFGAAHAGASFVPINPILKPQQLAHILGHSNARVLLTSWDRLNLLQDILPACPELQCLVLVDEPPNKNNSTLSQQASQQLISYGEFMDSSGDASQHRRIDQDIAAILYTSGSTGKAKGVVLSHRNLVAGAESVSSYLNNEENDCLLAVLPLSFDAGLSQLTTAFSVGASVALLDYLMPKDVLRAAERHQITGLTGVPPLWNQLRDLPWSLKVQKSLRYIASTGGAMPVATTRALQAALPNTDIYLMYGLTESFRSTYLPPDQVEHRPESIGKAIPNAEVLIVNDAGEECGVDEVGELVHRGALVSMGYWRDAKKTAARFRPSPGRTGDIVTQELAVWSGDQVRKDAQGYLYFVGREDDMIKTSGYRVSPTEVEEVAQAYPGIEQAVALGLVHSELGQGILLLVTLSGNNEENDAENDANTVDTETALAAHCRTQLPNFMLPHTILCRDTLPQNQNGKLDRAGLKKSFHDFFQDEK